LTERRGAFEGEGKIESRTRGRDGSIAAAPRGLYNPRGSGTFEGLLLLFF